LLVDNRADINAKGDNRRTVLYLAAMRGNKEVVQLLVGNGADVKVKDNYRRTVLYSAVPF